MSSFRTASTARKQRKALAERDGVGCFYCPPNVLHRLATLTRDHVIPASHGGVGDRRNLVLACAKHNHNRGNESFISFVAKNPPAIRRLEAQSPLFVQTARQIGIFE